MILSTLAHFESLKSHFRCKQQGLTRMDSSSYLCHTEAGECGGRSEKLDRLDRTQLERLGRIGTTVFEEVADVPDE